LCINDRLETGSQLPYIDRGLKEGWDILVLNPNLNQGLISNEMPIYDIVDGKPVPKNDSPEKHVQYVWDKIIHPSKYNKIAIVAHSYGGIATVMLLNARGIVIVVIN
jgi:hypothetical protein